MTTFRPKLWTGVSAAVLASTLALSACGGGEGGEAGASGEGGSNASAPAGEGGEGGTEGGQAAPAGEGGEGGSEGAGSEAGASAAFRAVPAESRDALRLAQLQGFLLGAREQTGADAAEAARILVGQGLLEVYDPSKVEYTRLGLNEARLRRAAETGARADVDAALADIEAARTRAGGEPAAVVRAMTDIATGLYRETVVDGVVDPTEYAHSRGAALSAQAELQRAQNLSTARADMQNFVRLWASEDAPEDAARAATVQQVQTAASRLQLGLSGA